MKKLSSIMSLIMITVIVLVGCSKEELVEDVSDNKSNVRGVVKEVNEESILIESKDRIHTGDIMVSLLTEREDNLTEFDVGDIIVVYYDGLIAESYPAQISNVHLIALESKAEFSADINDNEEEESAANNDVDYYNMPVLSSNNNGESRELTKDQSAFVHDLISSVEWDKGSKKQFKGDYEILEKSDVLITFDSKSNILNDTKNDISVVLQESMSETLKRILDNEL